MIEGIQGAELGVQAALSARGGEDLEAAKRAAMGGSEEKLTQAFGKIFAQQLVKQMRESVEGGFFGSGSGAGIYESWFDEHLAEVLAADDALGLAGMIKASTPQGEPVAEAADGALILAVPGETVEAPEDEAAGIPARTDLFQVDPRLAAEIAIDRTTR